MTKICSKCKKSKDIDKFGKASRSKDGYKSACKKCRNLDSEKYYTINKKIINDNHKEYDKQNKDKISNRKKDYYINNKEVIDEKHRKYSIKKITKEKVNYRLKKRRKEDVEYYIRTKIRNRIYQSLKNKTNSSKDLLGCNIIFYLEYLENLFVNGMTWDNRKKWQIDHITPLSSFDLTDKNQLFEAFNYKNTQPLWAEDNLIKGNKLNFQK